MDPHYRHFFRHVLPVFWPWLWWNLVRLTAYRRRVRREMLVHVDRMGNVRIRFIADAPKLENLYVYEAPAVASWDRLAPGFCVPEAQEEMPGCVQAFCAPVRAVFGHIPDIPEQVRGPP